VQQQAYITAVWAYYRHIYEWGRGKEGGCGEGEKGRQVEKKRGKTGSVRKPR